MHKYRQFTQRLNEMADVTYALLRGAMLLALTMVLCAIALLTLGGGRAIENFHVYKTAGELVTLASAVLFVAVIASAIVEEVAQRKKR